MSVNGMNDGSWELQITITEFQVERTIRVRGDLHIGGLMLKLAESLQISNDWSDYGLWWPSKNVWLLRTRSTLDQYGVQSDSLLHFTPMHKILNVVLPDLQCFPLKINFAVNVFSVIVKLCKELGIRHAEELSLFRMLTMDDLRRNKGISATRRAQLPHAVTHNGNVSYDGGTMMASPFRNNGAVTPQGTLRPGLSPYSSPGINTIRHSPNYTNGYTMSPGSTNSLNYEHNGQELNLENSPQPAEPWLYVLRPRNYAEKARINAGWLDSSRSLFEQGIVENDIVCLKFKFYSFYDLNPKFDLIRINQLYQQARWSLISEEMDCTEEEMIMFAALQLQINHQSTMPQPDMSNEGEDEIDAALNDLQTTLEGTTLQNPNDITHTPELRAYLKYTKKKKVPTATLR